MPVFVMLAIVTAALLIGGAYLFGKGRGGVWPLLMMLAAFALNAWTPLLSGVDRRLCGAVGVVAGVTAMVVWYVAKERRSQ